MHKPEGRKDNEKRHRCPVCEFYVWEHFWFKEEADGP
jgi:hypothetical protein